MEMHRKLSLYIPLLIIISSFIMSALLIKKPNATLPKYNGCVQSPPSIEKEPPHEQLYQVAQLTDEADRPFMLECEANGDPEPTYRWIKNGLKFNYVAYDKRINQKPRRGTLVFTKPDNVDEGLYQCFAENKHGVSVSNAVFLRKSELNSFANEEMEEIFAVEGEALTLDCNPPTGYPKPYIFWMVWFNTKSLASINSSRLTVDPEGRLHFSNVTKEDMFNEAEYACFATSVFTTEYKVGRKTKIKVEASGTSGQTSHSPEIQYISPTDVIALKGQKLELHCIFGGTPLPDIVWSKENRQLEGSHFSYTNYGKTLVINEVNFSDSGEYGCTASNGIGSRKSHSMLVKVNLAPFWIEYPNNTNSTEGETVQFKCIASGIPDPKLQWFVNGISIEKAPKNPRRKVEGNVMTISDMIVTLDTSVFQCNASNVHGYAFRNFYLNVLKLPPTIIERPDAVSRAVITQTRTLRCRVFGAPKPEVKWEKNGQELSGGRFEVLESGDLVINEVFMTDAGIYECKATNRFGDDSASGELEVKEKTRITNKLTNIEVEARKMAVFRCSAEADSTLIPKIEWLFNGKKIDLDHDPRIVQSADNSLTITTTKELDSGIYTCVAKTDLDSVSAEATLTVQDVPNAPEILNVECDGNTALVEWQSTGDRRAPIFSYSIQFNNSFTPDNWEDAFVNISPPDTKFKVAMSPWANYTFRVIARNKIGSSEASGPSNMCSTQEEVPHRNPNNVVGRGTKPNNLVIRWTPMPLIEQNAPNFYYKVFWRRNDIQSDPWNTIVINDWKESMHMIGGQPTFKPYSIKVEAHNREGQARIQATELIGYSGEDKPLQIPHNFHLYELKDSKSAHFNWEAVQIDSVRGHFRGYKIQTWITGEDMKQIREVTIPPNVTQAIISVLKPFTKNFAHIVVFNDVYTSDPSNLLTINTPEGTPGPVSMFDGITMGSNALYLFWTKPEEPNGLLLGYEIFYEVVIGNQMVTRKLPINDPNATSSKIASLAPQTKYRVTIHGFTSKGIGEGYYIELTTKSEDAAEYPDKPFFDWYLRKAEDGTDELKVQWNPTSGSSRKPGSYFYVQYKLNVDDQYLNTPKDENQDSTIVTIKGFEPDKTYVVRVVAVDGQFETPSETQEISSSGIITRSPNESTSHFANLTPWLIGMTFAIALIIVLIVLGSVVNRNRGGKYSVHEEQDAQRMEDNEDTGFNEYNKRSGGGGTPHHKKSRETLINSQPAESDSFAKYGEEDSSNFGEYESFIGEYGPKEKRQRTSFPVTGIETFV